MGKSFYKITKDKFFLRSLILLSLYLWGVLSLEIITIDSKVPIFLTFIVSIVLTFFVLKTFSKSANDIKMDNKNEKSFRWGFIVFFITLIFFTIYWLGQFPGGFTSDSVGQYNQATGVYGYIDWHPVLHTLLFFTLPLKTGLKLGFIIFWQLLCFSLVFGYISYVMHKNGCPKVLLICMSMFVWINPFMATYMMFPWKDIGFTIFSLLIMAYYIQIISTKGEWLSRYRNIIIFSVALVVCAFLRHNGILFVFPLATIALVYAVKSLKARILTLVSILICFGGVKLVYHIVKVEAPDKRVVETVGLPVTIWCNVMKKNPSSLPKDTQDFFYTLATKEGYETVYCTGDFNSIKWTDFDMDKLDELSYFDVLKYTGQCFWRASNESIEAFAKLTNIVWALNSNHRPKKVKLYENPFNFKYKDFIIASFFTKAMTKILDTPLTNIFFGSNGFHFLILLIIASLLLVKGRTSILHLVPLFCYDFGTMLLLSGDDYRFFLLNIPLWIPTMFMMFKDKQFFKKRKNRVDADI